MENVSGENPYISISSFRKNSIFMITIKNRYEGELNYKDSDLPETTKSGKEHGIGLHNIRRVARMYMGDISLEQENREVALSIMLQVFICFTTKKGRFTTSLFIVKKDMPKNQ